MNETQNRSPDPDRDEIWKALDAFSGVEPHPQSRARFWARVAREKISTPRRGSLRWLVRYVLPVAGAVCVIAVLYIGGNALLEKRQADREIAENIELYRNYEVIQSLPKLAAYDRTETETEMDYFDMIQ